MRQPLPCLGFAGIAALTAATLPAQPSATISGSLIDDRGAPAADIEVVLRPHPSAFEADLYVLGHSDALPEAVDGVRSDANGGFSVSAPAAGPYRLEFRRSAAPNELGTAIPLVHGTLAPLKGAKVTDTIEVPGRHSVAVRVLDTEERPIEDALVVASPTVWLSPRTMRTMTRMVRDMQAGNLARPTTQMILPAYHPSASRTDDEGIARLPMPTAEATVVVSASGFVLGKGATRSGRAALRLERDPGVRVRVRGPTGAPAPGVLIRTASARDEFIGAGASNALATLATPGAFGGADTPLAVTDENGEAVVGRTPGAETGLEVEAADGAFARLSLPAAAPAESPRRQHIIEVRLEDPLRIPGRIVDATSGLPIHSAAVWVQLFPGRNAFSDSTGAFDLNTRPAPGGTRLLATAVGFLPERIDIGAADLANREEVRIALKPSAPIRGTVTDDAGRPVAGASIRAEPRGAGVPPASSFFSFGFGAATSGADGSFQVEEVSYGHTYRLTAQAPGYAASILDLPPLDPGVPVEPVQLVLTEGRRVRGSVVDTNGNPVAAAEVSLLWPLDPSDFRSMLEAPAASATTDGGGAFALPATGPGEYEVRVKHADYADRPLSRAEVPAGASDFDLGDLTLVAGGTIHGIVTGADGEPVARATIQARERHRIGSATRTATTDAGGRFRVDGLSSDLADVGVRASGYPLLVVPGVRVGDGDPEPIRLKPGAAVTGRVLDAGGNGVAGVPVRLQFERDFRTAGDPRLWSITDTFPRRVTDKDGRFRFDGLAAGAWSAETRKDAEGAKLEGIALAPGAERDIELVLRTRDRLTVIVATSLGEPVAGADIRLEAPGERLPVGYGQTDASGRSVIDVTPGAATVKVGHDTLRDESRQVQLEPGDTELRFELQPGTEIRGTVRSYDGAPLGLATVAAATEYEFGAESHRTNTVSDENGAFRLTGLEPRRYNLTARSPGYADGGPDQPIQVGDGAVEGIEIVLERGASIVGAVTGLSPSDLNQVEIQLWRNSRLRRVSPETDGSFQVDGIAPGAWRAIAVRGQPGSEHRITRTVTVERGVAETFVELPFEPGYRLTGQVFDGGEPLGNAGLRVSGRGHDHSQSARTDREGRFEMTGLQPGAYRLTISRSSFGTREHRSIELHSDVEGLRIDLEPSAATIVGVVVDARTGQPIDMANVTAADAAAIGALASGENGSLESLAASGSATFTSNDGRFELKLRANAEQLWVTSDGYEDATTPIGIVPGERPEALVIRLQPTAPEAPVQ